MAWLNVISGTNLGTPLGQLLNADAIEPGSQPSYQLCKLIFEYHVLGKKMVDTPVKMAMSQPREITVPRSPEERVVKAFNDEWKKCGADTYIAGIGGLARMYGIASAGLVCDKLKPMDPIPFDTLAELDISFNLWDPLNTAGSLVFSQNPNSPDLLKPKGMIRVGGEEYARGRTVTLMHEQPIYISYTTSGFGFVGRSVYQRALYPLKTFVASMKTDNLVCLKAGVIIAKIKQAGSIINEQMRRLFGFKRNVVKEAETDDVISIGNEDEIATLNMQNLDGAYGMARKNTVENIATAADMPALILNQETFAEGFGEGVEDAKKVAGFVQGIRTWLQPVYDWLDPIVQHRAWSPEFYKAIQAEYADEYGEMEYKTALYQWKNSFQAIWPSLLLEPESEQAKKEKVKFEAIIAMLEVLLPTLDPENKAKVIQWAADNCNENEKLFSHPLLMDYEKLAEYVPPVPMAGGKEPGEPKPFAAAA